MKQYFVYILECSDLSYYTGVTNDLERRLLEHEHGIDPDAYTFKRKPVKVVYYNQFSSITQAVALEKQIKGWTRKKKEALINEEWDKLPDLAKCLNKTSHENYKKNK